MTDFHRYGDYFAAALIPMIFDFPPAHDFSLIFSLTAKTRLNPTEHQTAQYTALLAQKMTAKHGKTGPETRKTGSSPVLSTI